MTRPPRPGKRVRTSASRPGAQKVGTEKAGTDKMRDTRERGGATRLQKILAAAGLGSRRKCEELIVQGRVEVDGRVVDQLGACVAWGRQQVRVDGTVLRPPRWRYFLIHKPKGVVSTHRDPARRTRVIDLLPPGERLFPVGRLDSSSEGLMLVTNDGEMANRLAHPRYGITKTYHVSVVGLPDQDALEKMRRGIYLSDGRVSADRLRILRRLPRTTVLEMILSEGRNREVRRMLARIGHKVVELKRVAIGPLRLGQLPSGSYRPLSDQEMRQLQKALLPVATSDRQPATAPKFRPAEKKKRSPSGPSAGRPRQQRKSRHE